MKNLLMIIALLLATANIALAQQPEEQRPYPKPTSCVGDQFTKTTEFVTDGKANSHETIPDWVLRFGSPDTHIYKGFSVLIIYHDVHGWVEGKMVKQSAETRGNGYRYRTITEYRGWRISPDAKCQKDVEDFLRDKLKDPEKKIDINR